MWISLSNDLNQINFCRGTFTSVQNVFSYPLLSHMMCHIFSCLFIWYSNNLTLTEVWLFSKLSLHMKANCSSLSSFCLIACTFILSSVTNENSILEDITPQCRDWEGRHTKAVLLTLLRLSQWLPYSACAEVIRYNALDTWGLYKLVSRNYLVDWI
jgi:hypothetical protein